MPAIVSHYLLASKVFSGLSELRPELELVRDAFIWGASGPDIFFCHRLFPYQKGRSLRKYGTMLHNMPAETLINYLVSYARNKNNDIVMSYALGFVTHYAYDSIAHPYILYKSEVMEYKQPEKHRSVWHNQIESALDSILLIRERGIRISKFRLQSAAPINKRINEAIAAAMQGYMLFALGKGIYRSEIVKAQVDWHNSLAALNDSTGIKQSFISKAERLVGLPPMLSPMFRRDVPDISYDPANLSHRAWYDETGRAEHSESFFELTDLAEERSVELISKLLSGKKLTSDDCKASFSGY